MLIKCKECEKEISDKAATCPGCGAPVVVTRKKFKPSLKVEIGPKLAPGSPHVVTERTAKPLKAQQALSGCIIIVGCLIFFFSLMGGADPSWIGIGGSIFVFGLIWSTIIGIKVWWHHG